MQPARKILFVITVALLLAACGSVDDGQKISRGSKSFDFTPLASIDLPVSQEEGFELYVSVDPPHDASYIIEDGTDLADLNATLADSEKLAYSDLDAYTYFLIRNFYCNEYYAYTGASYTPPTLTITLDHYLIAGVACPAVVVEPYLVFKAAKAP